MHNLDNYFGNLDTVLILDEGIVGKKIVVCVSKFMTLNGDKMVLQIFDGGTVYAPMIPDSYYGCRLILRSGACEFDEIQNGVLLELSETTSIKILKSGEKILDCKLCRICGRISEDKISSLLVGIHPKSTMNNIVEEDSKTGQKTLSPETHTKSELYTEDKQKIIYPDQKFKLLNNPEGSSIDEKTHNFHNEMQTASSLLTPAKVRVKEFEEKSKTNILNKKPHQAARSEPYIYNQDTKSRKVILPIAILNKFNDKWTVKARVTSISEIKTYSNAKGSGKIMTIDLVDKSGEIRCTFFNDVVDRLQPLIEKNKIYFFSNGILKEANSKFKKFPHQYEITFTNDTTIDLADQDDDQFPTRLFNPQPLSLIEKLSVGSPIDFISIIVNVSRTTQVLIKSLNTNRDRRNLSFIDNHSNSYEMTVWGENCSILPQNPEFDKHIYLVNVYKARVDEYNGRRIKAATDTDIELFIYNVKAQEFIDRNPPNNESFELLRWYLFNKSSINIKNASFHSLLASEKKSTIQEIEQSIDEEGANSSILMSKGMIFTTCARVNQVILNNKNRFFWTACPTCGKKVEIATALDEEINIFSGTVEETPYNCKNCNLIIKEPIKKLNFQLEIEDYTGTAVCTIMAETAERLLNVDVQTLDDAKSLYSPNEMNTDDYLQSVEGCEFILKILAKSEIWQDAIRVKKRIIAVEPLKSATLKQELERLTQFIDVQLKNI